MKKKTTSCHELIGYFKVEQTNQIARSLSNCASPYLFSVSFMDEENETYMMKLNTLKLNLHDLFLPLPKIEDQVSFNQENKPRGDVILEHRFSLCSLNLCSKFPPPSRF